MFASEQLLLAANHAFGFALTALLVWVYGAAQVFLFGAEVTWIFAQSHGSRRALASAVQDKVDTPA